MGVSTDAILAFGFDLGDEEDGSLADLLGAKVEDGDFFDFEEWFAAKGGAIYPEGNAGIDSPEYRAYAKRRKEVIAACPVEIVIHCSYDYPMNFLALRGSVSRAWRGHPISVATPTPTSEQVESMRHFCEAHSIEWREPAWHIFSMWG